VSIPSNNPQNQSPAAMQQYYGRAKIDPASRAMTVSLHDLNGKSLWEIKLDTEQT
jgi:alkaline phosphatase D